MKAKKATIFIISVLITVSILNVSCSNRMQNFSALLKSVQKDSPQRAERRIREFSELHDFPFVEDSVAYFLFEDTSRGQPVYLAGDFTGWRPDSLVLNRIGKTPFYFLGLTLPLNARVEYKFVVGQRWLLDPLNPHKELGGFGPNSVLMMPAYRFPREALLNMGYRVSRLDTFEFKSKILHNKREVVFYRHPKASPRAPLLVFNDGGDYLRLAVARIILDNLIGSRTIRPLNALFVNPVRRNKEYWLNDRYLRMVFDELLPQVFKKYGLTPDTLGFGGASLGGEIALYALRDYGKRLDFVFSQSGALGIEHEKLLDILQALPRIETKIYVSYGIFENVQKEHARLQSILETKKVQYRMQEFPEGHNWGNWRGHLKDVLTFFRGH